MPEELQTLQKQYQECDEINRTAELVASGIEDSLLVQTGGRWKGTARTARMAMHCGRFVKCFAGSARQSTVQLLIVQLLTVQLLTVQLDEEIQPLQDTLVQYTSS